MDFYYRNNKSKFYVIDFFESIFAFGLESELERLFVFDLARQLHF